MQTPTETSAHDPEGVRAFVQDRLERVNVAFAAALQKLSGVATLPGPLLIIDEQNEDDLLEAARECERARKLLRYWRHARGPEGADPYPYLQAARQHAMKAAMAPDDPTHRYGQELERSVARSFYNQTSDEYLGWWLAQEGTLARA
jgi:hypothetical protein